MLIDFPTITPKELQKYYPWTSELKTHLTKKTEAGTEYSFYYKDKLTLILITLMDMSQAPLYVNHKEYGPIVDLVLEGKLSLESRHFKSLMNILNPYEFNNKTLRLLIRLHEEYSGYGKSSRFKKEVQAIFDKVYDQGDEESLEQHILAMEGIKEEIDQKRKIRKDELKIIEMERQRIEKEKNLLREEARQDLREKREKEVREFLPVFLEYQKIHQSRKLGYFEKFLSESKMKSFANTLGANLWSTLLNLADKEGAIIS